MTQPAIKVEGLWKEYVMGAAQQRHGTFYDLLTHSLKAPFNRLRKLGGQHEEAERFWALRDVNFEIQPGEVVGVIGRNGAGKSTLLKILSRITAPTKGRISVRGRLASLLEVGTGFHPELSGRENIFLNGAILGMSRAEVARKFDEIVAFAEVEKFIDTPVKRYSSGMYVRLAFAVAAYLEPEILVVDEVLAVGDAEFQRKCLGKMNDVRNNGRTVIIVSHNVSQLSKICQKAIYLEQGKLVSCGSFDVVAEEYSRNKVETFSKWIPLEQSDDNFIYKEVSIVSTQGAGLDLIRSNQDFRIRFQFALTKKSAKFRIALQLLDSANTIVFSSSNTDLSPYVVKSWDIGLHEIYCIIPGNWLAPGVYFLTISEPSDDGDKIIDCVCKFTIDSADSINSRDGRLGVISPLLNWVEGV